MSLIKRLLLEAVSEGKREIIENNIRKRLYKIFKHEGHLERVLAPNEPWIEITGEKREQLIKSNILLKAIPITRTLIDIDPTDNGQYLVWIYSVFIKNDHYLPTHPDKLVHPSDTLEKIKEDADRVKSYLKLFEENKALIKRQGHSININDYDTPQDLLEVVKQFRSQTEDGDLIITKKYVEDNFDNDEAEVFFENDEWIIVIPKSERASCILGVDSEWCTSYGEDSPREDKRGRTSMFSQYKDDPLFILQSKSDKPELYQFSFDSKEFMDSSDRKIDISDFFEKHPDIKEAFNEKGYFLDDITQIEHLIYDEKFDEAVDKINSLGYGYVGVIEIDNSQIITNRDVDHSTSDIITEIFDVDIDSFSNLSEFLMTDKQYFMSVSRFTLKAENIIDIFSKEEKENIISNSLDKFGNDIRREVNTDLPTDNLFREVFTFINEKEKIVPDEIELTVDHIDDHLYNDLKKYIEEIIERMGYHKVEDDNYYFTVYYELYDSGMMQFYLSEQGVNNEEYEAIERIDEIINDHGVQQLTDEMMKDIKYAKDNKIKFDEFEDFILFITIEDKNVAGLEEIRHTLQLREYLDSNIKPVNDPEQMRLKLENSIFRYFLK